MRTEIPVTMEYLRVKAWGEGFNWKHFKKKRKMAEANKILFTFYRAVGVPFWI